MHHHLGRYHCAFVLAIPASFPRPVPTSNMAGLTVEVHDGAVVQTVKFLRAYWPLILPAAIIFRFVYYRYASPLRLYPGPFLASGSRAWKVWSTYSGRTETDHIHLHEKYGKTAFASSASTNTRPTINLPQVRSSASPPTSYPSPRHTLPARSSPPAKDSTRQTSTPSSHPRTTQTSSPKPTSTPTGSRNATLLTRTLWRRCKV